ncbi:hypothetical protein NL676_016360 [Syzygium grande]|nr:hypothetical protein NL676_016360 [Syzygium grande]
MGSVSRLQWASFKFANEPMDRRASEISGCTSNGAESELETASANSELSDSTSSTVSFDLEERECFDKR